MGFPRLDVVLGLTAGGVELLVEVLAAPALEIGDDVAGVAPIGADLDPGDDAARFRPGPGRIEECLEPAQLLAGLAGITRSRRRLQSGDILRQTAVLRQAKDIAQSEPVTQVQNLRCAILAVGAQQDLGPGPMPADLADQPTNVGRALGPLGPARRA